MRKRTGVALVGLLLTASGCKLTLPSGFPVVPVTPTGSAKPSIDPGTSEAPCKDRFAKYDKDQDGALSLDEYLAKGGEKGDRSNKGDDARNFLALDADGDRTLSPEEFAAGCNGVPPTPKPTPAVTSVPTPPPGAGCDDNFGKYDRDGDGAWDLKEFMGWDASRPRPKMPCGGGFISDHGGGIISNNGGGTVIAAGGGNLIAARGLQQVNGGMVRADGSVIISNQGGGIISNGGGTLIANGGGLIANNEAGLIHDFSGRVAPLPFPCPPDDPKFRFAQFDHDGDGLISAREFCDGPLKRPTPPPSWGPEPYPYPTPMPTPGVYGCEEGFFQADQDGDGLISPEEFKARYHNPEMVYSNNGGRGEWIAAPTVDPYSIFKAQDQDGDGYLSLEESCGYPVGPIETPPPADWCGFYKIDADGNGEATWEEFVNWSVRNEFPAPSKDVIYTRFAGQDFDQNMVITQDEYCGYAQPEPYPYPSPVPSAWATPTPAPTPVAAGACLDAFFKAGGTYKSEISFEAYGKARFAMVNFIQAPSDEDVANMIESFASQARAFDRNGDGMLTYDEAKGLCAMQDG